MTLPGASTTSVKAAIETNNLYSFSAQQILPFDTHMMAEQKNNYFAIFGGPPYWM